MKTVEKIKKSALKTIDIEAKAIDCLKNFIDDDFAQAIEIISQSSGRVVVTGIGKSAIIAQKIVATLNSTGTPSVFMHAADAIHGDLGIIQKEDVVVCISNSGNTPEIKVLVPMLKNLGACLVAMAGNKDSFLARHADFIINTQVEKEASPNSPAPTSSTTAQLVMGDALAVALLELKGFSLKDFAKYHPGGALGKQMYMKVSDLYTQNEKPEVAPDADLKTLIFEISSKRLGSAAVTKNKKILGIITDGDLRRMLQNRSDFMNLKAKDIMNQNPKTIGKDILAVDALQVMRHHNITQLLVVDNDEYLGIVHLHDILHEGIL